VHYLHGRGIVQHAFDAEVPEELSVYAGEEVLRSSFLKPGVGCAHCHVCHLHMHTWQEDSLLALHPASNPLHMACASSSFHHKHVGHIGLCITAD
jgi:hypothetical protein